MLQLRAERLAILQMMPVYTCVGVQAQMTAIVT